PDRLFHVVFDGLRKSPDYPRDFLQFPVHGRDHFFLVLVKHGAPLFLRLQADVVFGVEKAGCIRAVVRTPRLTGAFGNLGKSAKYDSGLVRQADTFAGSRARSESTAHPKRAFIQVRKELGTDDTTQCKIYSEKQTE